MLGSISAAVSCLVRSAGSFPEQRLVIEPKVMPDRVFICQLHMRFFEEWKYKNLSLLDGSVKLGTKNSMVMT